jgi:hypothetical protein
MKAFDEAAEKQFQRAGPILLFVGEAIPRGRDLTSVTALMSWLSGFEPCSRLPGSERNQWPWEFVTRHSGATVLDFHEVPSVDHGMDG